jgi:hypothetical protein
MKRLTIFFLASALLACSDNVITFTDTLPSSGTAMRMISGAGGAVVATGSVTTSAGGSSVNAGGSGGFVISDASIGDARSIACPGGPEPTLVAATTANALASSPTFLYWLDEKLAVMRQSKSTGATEKLADMSCQGVRIRVDDTRVFWEECGSGGGVLYSLPLDLSAGAVRLATSISEWAISTDRVFYFTYTPGTPGATGEIDSVPKTGGAPTILFVAAASANEAIAADDSGVYWFDTEVDGGAPGFLKFDFAANAKHPFANSQIIRFLLADGSHVIWSDGPDIGQPAGILWSPPTGGTVTTVASGQTGVIDLAADATNAYWMRPGPLGGNWLDPSDLVTAPLDGGPQRTLACFVRAPSLAVGDDAVYLAAGLDGAIWKIAKN